MAVDASVNLVAFERRARRAYERGRALGAAARATLVAAAIVALASALAGRATLLLAPLPFVAWALLGWRGGALLRGGRGGLAVGAATLLVPMSLLRPCCRPGAAMTGDCCTMPGVCVLAGALLGASLAAWVPRGRGARRIETIAGMLLGMASVAAFRCRGLFVGEALGLLGGLAGGVAVAALGVALLDRRRAASA